MSNWRSQASIWQYILYNCIVHIFHFMQYLLYTIMCLNNYIIALKKLIKNIKTGETFYMITVSPQVTIHILENQNICHAYLQNNDYQSDFLYWLPNAKWLSYCTTTSQVPTPQARITVGQTIGHQTVPSISAASAALMMFRGHLWPPSALEVWSAREQQSVRSYQRVTWWICSLHAYCPPK